MTTTIDVDQIFDTTTTFAGLGLNEGLLKAVAAAGYEHPTKAQSEIIPLALAGRDILGQSKTGTGKTAAFGLPLIQIVEQLEEDHGFSGLVLTPTRELAIQVTHDLRNQSRFTNVRVVAVYGGQRMRAQIPKLQKSPHIIVGTPGRVMDFHRRGQLPYDHVKVAILDEVDRMLDIGFRDDIRRILGAVRHRHQTIFVSATISAEIERLARQYLNDPVKLVLTASSLTVAQVQQTFYSVERWDKNRLLVHLLEHEDPELTLVFCRTKHTVDGLTEYLNRKGIDAHAIHGDMYQSKRDQVMQKFRKGHLSVLIASDLAARGLDVGGITHVINYDLPEDPELYVHRIGRTARAGREGKAWSLVTPEQGAMLTAIEKLTNVQIEHASYGDFQPGPVPPEVVRQREREAAETETMRMERSRVAQAPPGVGEARNDTKYPGGAVPVEMPAKRLGGKLRTRRR